MKQNWFYLIKQASEMSKITLSVIVYAPCLNKTMIKSNKKQMISSADTFFWMTRYHYAIRRTVAFRRPGTWNGIRGRKQCIPPRSVGGVAAIPLYHIFQGIQPGSDSGTLWTSLNQSLGDDGCEGGTWKGMVKHLWFQRFTQVTIWTHQAVSNYARIESLRPRSLLFWAEISRSFVHAWAIHETENSYLHI